MPPYLVVFVRLVVRLLDLVPQAALQSDDLLLQVIFHVARVDFCSPQLLLQLGNIGVGLYQLGLERIGALLVHPRIRHQKRALLLGLLPGLLRGGIGVDELSLDLGHVVLRGGEGEGKM